MLRHDVKVSPTLIFNDDRQRLTGNVGYRIIEANVRELLRAPEREASWCWSGSADGRTIRVDFEQRRLGGRG
jgi:hypothetical protein